MNHNMKDKIVRFMNIVIMTSSFAVIMICYSGCATAPVIRADTAALDSLIEEAKTRGDETAVKKLTSEKNDKISLAKNLATAETESKKNASDAGKWKGFLVGTGILFGLGIMVIGIKIVLF